MKFLASLIILISSLTSFAQEMYPKGCVPWVIHDAMPKLSAKKPVVIMLHNVSDTELWITHPVVDPGAQAGFSSLLQSGKWSALAFSQISHSFALQCIESRPGHEQQISCETVLAICQWPNSKLPKTDSGVFWAAENMDIAPLKAYIERQGYDLNSSSGKRAS